MNDSYHYDVVVIGSGPAGQKAAIQAAKSGCIVALIESDRKLGGACVQRGTIPSKTLRESALRIQHVRSYAGWLGSEIREELEMAPLVSNLQKVINSHNELVEQQIARNDVIRAHGKARFLAVDTLQVTAPGGQQSLLHAERFIIATGSIPRLPDSVPVDHEHIMDSDSILSMIYLPRSLTVLGGGIIACEYASIFATLGVEVTMIDRYERPLGFLDPELIDLFMHAFAAEGGSFIGSANIDSVTWDGVAHVRTRLDDGTEFNAEKMLCAAGRVANVDGLGLSAAGIELTQSGHIPVDAHCRTSVAGIYAAGDVIGPPALASASMEQGRRASIHAHGDDAPPPPWTIPMGIYAIPEMSTVGLDEKAAKELYGEVLVGRAPFEEIARGQISGIQDGLLKMVATLEGKLLGVQIIGEGATELIHIGQMGLLGDVDANHYVDNIFNFPTLAEAYRVAALEITGQIVRF